MAVSLDLSRTPRIRASSAKTASAPPNLSGLTRPQLAAALVAAEICGPDKARMRSGQLWRWMHHHGATSFDAMTNVDKQTRARLEERFSLARPEVGGIL